MGLFALCGRALWTKVLAVIAGQTTMAETFSEVRETELEDIVGDLNRSKIFACDGRCI
jgi:hypothetical protein